MSFTEIFACIYHGFYLGCTIVILFRLCKFLAFKNDILKIQLEKMKTDNKSTGD